MNREFKFTKDNFNYIRKVLLDYSGITLNDSKDTLVYSRVIKRIKFLGLKDFDEYCQYLRSGKESLSELMNSLTTNVTKFFREEHHFEHLKAEVFAKTQSNKIIKIWSAGCSTGEEPYSIAISAFEHFGDPEKKVHIQATDLDTKVLDHAQKAVYAYDKNRQEISKERLKNFFYKGKGDKDGFIKVATEVKKLISFDKLNLNDRNWSVTGPLDVIFCRNVMIYFDKDFQARLIERYTDLLADGGILYIGHSENILKNDRLDSLGNTIYRKIT